METSCQQPTLSEQQQRDLWRLRARWLEVYHVALVDEVWRAKRYHDVTKVITADTADELSDAIKADYASVVRP